MIIVRLIDAPTGLKGFCRADPDGNENVYINGRLSEDERRKTLDHELLHVVMGHLFDDTKTVEEKEREVAESEKTEVRTMEYTGLCRKGLKREGDTEIYHRTYESGG